MGMKARIEKLEKHAPPDEPMMPAVFYQLCNESGTKRLVYGDRDREFTPANEDDVRQVKQQGRQIVILHIPPGTVYRPPRSRE
jgi:hypothetical protein